MAELRSILLNKDIQLRYKLFNSFIESLGGNYTRVRILHSADQPRKPQEINEFACKRIKPPIPQTSSKNKRPQKCFEIQNEYDKKMQQVINAYNQSIKIMWKPDSLPIMPVINNPKQSKSCLNYREQT